MFFSSDSRFFFSLIYLFSFFLPAFLVILTSDSVKNKELFFAREAIVILDPSPELFFPLYYPAHLPFSDIFFDFGGAACLVED